MAGRQASKQAGLQAAGGRQVSGQAEKNSHKPHNRKWVFGSRTATNLAQVRTEYVMSGSYKHSTHARLFLAPARLRASLSHVLTVA
jgi:hypothetical protein